MIYVYRILLYLLLPAFLLRLCYRSLREPEYRRRLGERFGRVPDSIGSRCLWIHAVSAGEVIAATPIIEDLCEQCPDVRVLVTTGTPTGSAEVVRRLGESVDHCYLPYDLSFALRRFLRRTKPTALVLLETELWPNLIALANAADVPIFLVNARMSERSARAYARLPSMTQPLLRAIRGIACQYEDTAQRFIDLGARPQSLTTTGSVKFDVAKPVGFETTKSMLESQWCRGRPVWIAASTHSPEEETVLEAFSVLRRTHQDLFLILAPRHPHRAPALLQLARQRGFSARLVSEESERVDMVIVDHMGSLLTLYGLADVAFIGGSMQGTGGHNPIEPALHGVPMVMGPDRMNFEEIARRFEEADCLYLATDAISLARQTERLFDDPSWRETIGRAATTVVAENQGARQRLLTWLTSSIAEAERP